VLKNGRKMTRFCLLVGMLCTAPIWADSARAQVPAVLAAPGEAVVATIHAEGAQIYECNVDTAGKATWLFREPITTLILNDKTIGRHYAGPTWELTDGSAVTGKAISNSPGATAADIPWLKLDVVNHRGNGLLSNVTTVQRINTRGGVAQGMCDQRGSLLSVPCSADYSFLNR
jgi:Protein of unknown function (DUF3455)